MTFSAFLSSILGHAPSPREGRGAVDVCDHRSDVHADDDELRRYKACRKLISMSELALPAKALARYPVAQWVREHRVAVDVHTGEDIAAALAAGIPFTRITLFANLLSESDLRAAANLGFGRVAVGSIQQIALLRSVVMQHEQDIVVCMTDGSRPILAAADGRYDLPRGFRFDSNAADTAIAAVLDHEWLNLVGLHCEVGSQDDDFVSYPAAIGHMIAEMAQVRRNHGKVLTRLGLGGGRAMPTRDWGHDVAQLAAQIDGALDDACGTLRFPRPVVVLSAGLGFVGRSAA